MCTSLVPGDRLRQVGALAKDAFKKGKTVRQLAYETVVGVAGIAAAGTGTGPGGALTKADIDRYLDPWSMTLPGGEGSAGG
jgi:hypothetical protein